MLQVKLIVVVVALLLGWVAVRPGRPAGGERQGRADRARWLALGDSYTIGESVDAAERYPVQARRMLLENGLPACGDPEIIAVTGWTTANLLDALSGVKPAPEYRMVSLLIGVNNQYQGRSQAEYREQFGLLLQQCIRLAGSIPSHVVVLSIPDYSVTPFARHLDTASIAAQIDSFNRINYELAKKYEVNYVDITAESRRAAVDPSLIAADGLHFSGKEYGNWARLMEPVVKEILK